MANHSSITGSIKEKIIVLDFGSQYAQLITRRVRQCQVYCHIVPHSITASEVAAMAPKGMILSGGPSSVYEEGSPRVDPSIFSLGIPVLGICYGMQLMCDTLGAEVESVPSREYGRSFLTLNAAGGQNVLFEGISPQTQAWMSHADQVTGLSNEFIPLASTATCPVAAVVHKDLPVYGIQFHPEVTHTPEGMRLIENFVYHVCKAERNWTMKEFAEKSIAALKERIGSERVICGLSGGVDSAVTAALLSRAIGEQLVCIFVDTGLMRKGEMDSVREVFTNHFKADLRVVQAEDRFLTALAGVTDPQQKRKIIGKLFIDCFTEAAAEVHGAKYLAQGTIYPDVIESGGTKDSPASTIKYHHNVGGLPKDLQFELVEPLRELYKDEVRKLGLALGLPEEIVGRHPFPGPGLAVRCLGALDKPKLDTLRAADAILIEEIRAADWYNKSSQVFCVLLPVRSVGVMGDNRTYENAVVIRAISSTDFMTADWCQLPYDLLAKISNRIINEVQGINRVVYDISSKPPATIEWE